MAEIHAGETAACPTQSRLRGCSPSNAECLGGLQGQGGAMSEGMAVELGPFHAASSSASDFPQSSHLSPFLAWDMMWVVNFWYVPRFQIILFLWSVMWGEARQSGLQMQVWMSAQSSAAQRPAFGFRAICIPSHMGLWHLWLPISFVSGKEIKLLLFFQTKWYLFFFCKIAENRATTVAVIKCMSQKPATVQNQRRMWLWEWE